MKNGPEHIRIGYRNNWFFVNKLLERLKVQGTIPLCFKDPEWQSRIVESLLVDIPIGTIIIDCRNVDKWIVVDGMERLGALRHFMESFLVLEGLQILPELNGFQWHDTPRHRQRKIEESPIAIFTIEYGTPDQYMESIVSRFVDRVRYHGRYRKSQ